MTFLVFIPHSEIAYKILQLKCNGVRLWCRINTVDLSAHVRKYKNVMYKCHWAGQHVFDKQVRHEAVLYSVDNEQHIGIVETIFAYYSTDKGNCPKLQLLRRVHIIYPDSGNVSIVEKFGNRSYAYYLSSTCHIQTNLVLATTLIQPIILVFDPYRLKKEHDINQWLDTVCTDPALLPNLPYFRVLKIICTVVQSKWCLPHDFIWSYYSMK